MKKTSILGLGAMGTRMATRLLQHGYPVVVYNRTPERAAPLAAQGATVAARPRDAVEDSDVVISMVRGDRASEAIWLSDETGAVHGLRTGAVAVESSTVTPAWTRRLANAVTDRNALFIDAPVIGSRPHAESGTLTHVVGGEVAALQQARPVLDVLGSALHHVGPAGTGSAVKLAVNTMFAVQAAALAELVAALSASGLEQAEAVEILNALPTASPAAARVATLMAEGTFVPNFPIHLVAKDLRYATTVAKGAGVDAAVMRATREVFEEAEHRGYGGDDIVGIAQLYTANSEHRA